MADIAQQILKNKITNYLFGSFGSTVAVFLMARRFDPSLTVSQSVLLGIVFAAILFALLLLWYVGKEVIDFFHKKYVESVWGVAIIKLKDVNADIHRLEWLDIIDEKDFITTMIGLCDKLKEVFDKKTRDKCCVSIKIPVKHTQDLMQMEVRNLCRDSSHPDRDTKKYLEAQHSVINNTAFMEVVRSILNNSKDLEYINNDISATKDYHNTSIGCYTQDKLPYNSELVYPILPIRQQGKDYKMCGFICIDCPKTNAFGNHVYDVAMVQSISDSIYDTMVRMSIA